MTPPINDDPDHGGYLDIPYDARCSDCGASANPPYTTVARFPDPTIDDPRASRERCHECYAGLLREHTELGEAASVVLALEVAGYSHEQIAAVIGRSVSRVGRLATDVRDARRRAAERGALDAVYQYI